MRLRSFPLASCLLAGTAGCFPAITHGPRVEQGFVIGLTGGGVSGATHVEGDEGGIRLRQPVLGPYVGYGWSPTRPSDPGFYLGAAVPLLYPLAQVDAFVQLPPAATGRLAAGVGTILSIEHLDGYVMVGGPIDSTSAWHIGGGLGTRYHSDTPAWALLGSAALEKASGRLRTQFFLQAAVGRNPGDCYDYPAYGGRTCSARSSATALAAGVSIGRHSRSAK